MGRTGIVFFLVMLALVSCTVPKSQEKIMIQCADGTLVDDATKCPVLQKQVVEQVKEIAEIPKELEIVVETTQPTVSAQPAVLPEKTIMQELLEKAPTLYWFIEGTYGAIVAGKKRSTGEYDQYWNYVFRLMYWDTDSKIVYVLAPYHIAESWWLEHQGKKPAKDTLGSTKYLPAFFKLELTGNAEIDKARIPIEFNKYWYDAKATELVRIIKPFYVKSPTDWMIEYKDDVPLKIDRTPKMVPWGGSNVQSSLAIYYKNRENPKLITVFSIMEKYNLPAIVEYQDDAGSKVKYFKFDFDTTYFKQGKSNVKLTEKLAELPEGSIIVTIDEFEEWIENIEG